ncbi:hypothetical protein HYDPIDRAFT_25118 [Hydnomerulius pinastri MD-312]|nr:hypothetical protein HYDPIDRAFT_25118 [Hydnomerulius pinastri MD-312]
MQLRPAPGGSNLLGYFSLLSAVLSFTALSSTHLPLSTPIWLLKFSLVLKLSIRSRPTPSSRERHSMRNEGRRTTMRGQKATEVGEKSDVASVSLDSSTSLSAPSKLSLHYPKSPTNTSPALSTHSIPADDPTHATGSFTPPPSPKHSLATFHFHRTANLAYTIFKKVPIGSTIQRIGAIPYDGEIFDSDSATLPYPTPDSPFRAVHTKHAGTLTPPPVSTQFEAKWIAQPDATDLLDNLLVCMVVDEDFAYTLLLNHHLNPLAIPHHPVSHLAERIHQANLIHQEPLHTLVRTCTAAHPPKPSSGNIKPEPVQGF